MRAAFWARFVRSAGEPRTLFRAGKALLRRLHSEAHAIALWRDLRVPFDVTRSKIQFDLRPSGRRDLPALLDTGAPGLAPEEKWQRAKRVRLFEAGIGACYVAVTEEGEPCYVQWIFGHGDGNAVVRYFGGAYPAPAEGQVLLEAAYTPPNFRGLGLMAEGMARIAELAAEHGAREALIIVGVDNAAAIKGSLRAGFAPRSHCVQRWRWFGCHLIFLPFESSDPHGVERLGDLD